MRVLADRYTVELFALDPILATFNGNADHDDRLTDFSPVAGAERAGLRRRTLRELDTLTQRGEPLDAFDVLAGRLLRERLEAELAFHDHGEELRAVSHMGSPAQIIKAVLGIQATTTDDDWEAFAGRLAAVPAAYASYRESLAYGMMQELYAAPRQVAVVAEQLGSWAGLDGEIPYFAALVSQAPERWQRQLRRLADQAGDALAATQRFLLDQYGPAAEDAGTRDAVGVERYLHHARYWNGIDLDLDDAYAYGWEEFSRIDAEMAQEAERVLAGASPLEAMHHLDRYGHVINGQGAMRRWLQDLMDEAMDALDGTCVDLDPLLRRVESRLAPPGGASAAYYTPPSDDFSRPGCTWFPTQGRDRFPTWEHVSTWYHEGVPGHHLQLAQWRLMASELSRYQASLGEVSANVEGWALYAERLMDELGFFGDPGRRMGFLVGQQLRAVRVIIDIGMHCELVIPPGQRFHPGERWTPELGREFLFAHAGSDQQALESELVRYLGEPAQAIGYKLGERVWLAGREEARRRRGASFDLKAWHMAALSQGCLGLDDLAEELARL